MRASYLVGWMGVVGILWIASGCNGGGEGYEEVEHAPVVEEDADHHHDEHGPHGGHLIELGNHEYHAEIVFDAETKKITVYILGAEPDEPYAIAQSEVTFNLMYDETSEQLKLAAAPQEGDAEGKSSRFELADHPTVAEHVEDEEDLEGRLSVVIDDTPYSGAIVHDHDHEHEHGEEDHEGEGHDEDHDHDMEAEQG